MTAHPPMASSLRVALVGAGRVGTAIASLLKGAGHDVVGVWSRTPASAERAASILGSAVVDSAAAASERADVVLIGASDQAIGDVARGLVGGLADHAVVVHFAGALGIGPLEPVAAAGASRAALHPVQSIPDVELGIARLPGSAWGVTSSPEIHEWAVNFVERDLHGSAVAVAEDDRPLWHAAAVMTSNGIAALLSTGAALLSGIGIDDPRSVLGPLAAGTLANARALEAAGEAFTGPVVRGDRATVESHLAALGARFPELVPEYALVARAIVAGASRTSRIRPSDALSMRRLLESA